MVNIPFLYHLDPNFVNEQVIIALHQCGASLEKRDQHGCAALHFAAAQGNLDAVRALVDAGANVATASTAGDTPLHTAASAGAAHVVQLLVAEGGADSCGVNRAQRAPLHLAASNGNACGFEENKDKEENKKGRVGMHSISCGCVYLSHPPPI